jgi:hypothetical protein
MRSGNQSTTPWLSSINEAIGEAQTFLPYIQKQIIALKA